MSLNKSYWILFNGEIIDLEGDKHISAVISDPGRFRITRKEIENIYKKYDEPLGIEAGHDLRLSKS